MKPGKILETLVTLSFTTLERSINTIMSFEWQEKTLVKKKNVVFFLKIYLHKNLVLIKKLPRTGQRILRRTLQWQKNAGEEKNVGFS